MAACCWTISCSVILFSIKIPGQIKEAKWTPSEVIMIGITYYVCGQADNFNLM